MSRNGRFGHIETSRPRRTAFDLSHDVKTSCDMGQLIPVYFQECVPGDTFSLGQTVLARMQPLVAPIMHPIKLQVHSFFVPTRLLMGEKIENVNKPGEGTWEEFIRGGDDGTDDIALPLWDNLLDTEPSLGEVTPFMQYRTVGTLWDYFRHPIDVQLLATNLPLAFDKRAYNLIFNEYYADSELDTPVDLDSEAIQYRRWEKDYFTSARPWQQRGTSPSFPLSGFAPLAVSQAGVVQKFGSVGLTSGLTQDTNLPVSRNGVTLDILMNVTGSSTAWNGARVGVALDEGTVGFDMNDLRTAVQIQRFLELGARSGKRYVEWLRAFFGVSPSDSRLQRPEYIGGATVPLVVSEVLQTAVTTPDSPQGNMAGHGITAGSQFIGKYHCQEFGYIVSIMSIMPEPVYQQGVNRQSLRRSRYDFYFPQFAHLSEQAIKNVELCATGTDNDNGNFGYQGRYDEMRVVPSGVTGLMRDTLDYWHISRKFALNAPPTLSSAFISTEGTIRKDIFAFFDGTPQAHGFIITLGNMVKAIRPLPYYGTPGLMDHN